MEKTTECALKDIDADLRSLIQEALEPGEQIQVCFRVEYHMIWVHIITDLRLISARAIALRSSIFSSKPKIEMPHLSFMRLKDVAACETGRTKEYDDLFTVVLNSTDGSRLEMNFTREDAAEKAEGMIRKGMDKKQFPPASTAERLRELSALQEMNLITDEEYQIKRAEILRDL